MWFGRVQHWRGLSQQWCYHCEAERGFRPSPPPPPRPGMAAPGPEPARGRDRSPNDPKAFRHPEGPLSHVEWVRCVVCDTPTWAESEMWKSLKRSRALPSQATLRAAYRAEGERYVLLSSRLRRAFPLAAILALLASIAAPWRVTPTDAIIVAFSMVGLVAFSAASEWRREYLAQRVRPALEQLLWRNYAASGERPPSDDVRERAMLRRSVPRSARKRLEREGYIPTWPLPAERVIRIQADLAMLELRKWLHPFHAAARFAFWCLVSSTAAFLLIWANQPTPCNIAARVCSGAIAGLDAHPSIGLFPYLTFNAVMFGNTPSDLVPRSPAAHLVQVATSVTGFVVLTIIGSRLWKRMRVDMEGIPTNLFLKANENRGKPSGHPVFPSPTSGFTPESGPRTPWDTPS